MTKRRTINFVTLGCSKNVVDSERIACQLKHSGFDIVFDSNDTKAKIVVINTCGFIGDAKEESVNTILKFAHAKTNGYITHLYVIGCLSERYKRELEQEIPEADAFFGVNDLREIVKGLGGTYNEELLGERMLTTPSHYAYLKISEGCNWGCGYCAIPLIRGKHRSVPMELLEEEARKLAAKGVKELMVIAQDTTYYGLDLYGERKLGELLGRLCRVEGIEWIRLHYAYPAQFPEDVITVMKNEPKMCHYLDIPFQHVSDSMLKSMRRGLSADQTQRLIDRLRAEIPDIAIRTTLLVGYPGESLQDVDELRRFVLRNRFDRLGVFTYSEEEGTYSARNLTDDVAQEEKERRADLIMELQREISLENNAKWIGTRQKVIIDRKENGFYIGRTQYDSPEVDQEVMVSTQEELKPGNFYMAEIYKVDNYDIYGRI